MPDDLPRAARRIAVVFAALALTSTIVPGVALSYSASGAGSLGHSRLAAANGAGTRSAFVPSPAVPQPVVPVPPPAVPQPVVPVPAPAVPVPAPAVPVPAPAVPLPALPRPMVFIAQQAVQPMLIVQKAGTGAGTVMSITAGGIDCGPTCSHAFSAGTQVRLTATPDAGSSFAGFSGGGCSGTAACTVTVGATSTIIATFNVISPPKRPLAVLKQGTGAGTVTSSTPGIECGPTCSHSFSDGAQVMLTATPDAGSSFAGFSGGGCSGTGSCMVTAGAAAAVTATFTASTSEAGELPITVVKDGNGTGTVTSTTPGIECGETCSHAFTDDAQVTLTATPDAGSSFAGFSGGGCSGTETCTVQAGTTVTATFTTNSGEGGELPITVVKDGNGTGTVTSTIPGIECGETCSQAFTDDAQVTLTATPDAGSSFAGFSGGGCSGTETCTVQAGTTVTATFTSNSSDTGELPFTGYNATGGMLLGLILIGFGFGGRLLARHTRGTV